MNVEKNVPVLRFEGFSDEWVEKPLNHEVELFSGLTYSPKDIRKEGVFVIRSSNVKNGQIVQADNVYVNPEVVNCSNVKKGDIIVVVRNGSRALIGKHAQVNSLMDHTVIGAFMTGVRASYPEFINALFDTDKFKAQVEKNLGATINQITNGAFNSMVFMFPEGQEKTAIGNTFQKLDNLINQHQQKHEKLSSLKKAMLEKMFPKQGETIPEIRFKGFSGEWEESNLEKCTDLLTGNPFNSKEFTSEGFFLVRGMNVKRGYLDSSPEISKFWPSSKGLERYLLEQEDIVVQMDGALIGKSYAKIKSINLPAILVQRVTRIRCSEVNSEFIYQYIQKDFLKHISGIKTETAVPHLSLHDIRAFSIFLPEIEEQNSIGSYFQKLDALINQHQQQITKLNNIKQACLSKMFV
ncbi:TPA: restriction endonuclease subunit S [Vibrio alginolyticus]